MTSLLRTVVQRFGALVPEVPQEVPCLAPQAAQRRVRAFAVLVVGFICIAYALMVNGYWHLAADSGIYLTLAQNLRAGNGYLFNGVRHTKYPSGLPVLLALAMSVSTSFLWLNAVQCTVMLAALGVLYAVLRQVADRPTALLVLLLTATLFWVHEYAMALMSETPFFLFSNISVLLLLLLVRPAGGRRRGLLLAGVCAVWALAFWCRMLACLWVGPFAVALLLSARNSHPLRNRALNAGLVCLVMLLALMVYRRWSDVAGADAPGSIPLKYSRALEVAGVVRRASEVPRWPLLLLCPPADVAARTSLPGPMAGVAAWLLALVILAGAWQALRRGQVFLAASVLFLAPFALRGPAKASMGRYGLAVAPFLVLLFLMGLDAIGGLAQRRLGGPFKRGAFVMAGVAFVLLPNLLLLAGDIAVQRSTDFYGVYRAGAYEHLTGIVKWLADRRLTEPVGAQDSCTWGAVQCLSQCSCVRLSGGIRATAPDGPASLAEFAGAEGLRYIITRSFEQPWPIWHLAPRRGAGSGPIAPYFRLWEYRAAEGEVREIDVPPVKDWPTRVPGKPKSR